jgi:hypothetical protein
METISFILGAGMVVGLLTGIFAVRIYRDVQRLKEQNQSLFGEVNDWARTMWEETSRIEREVRERASLENKDIYSMIDELQRQLDSRFDKFENRISKKQVLND